MKPTEITDPAAIAARCAWLRGQIESLPKLTDATGASGSDWIAMRTRRAQAIDALVARLRDLPDRTNVSYYGCGTAQVRMLGIRSTSTMGVDGALRNWLTRAEAASCTPRG